MRKKPSIFSKEYEKKMKQRRIRIFAITIICIVVIALLCIYLTGAFKTALKDVKNEKQSISIKNNNTKDVSKKQPTKSTESKAENKSNDLKYEVKLSSGKSVNLTYENNNNNKTFKDVTPKDANVAYSISPSKKNIVLFDDKSQSILLFDINGNKQDITNSQYVSTNGTVVAKKSQLSSNPSYIWCSSPKFIDNDNIAYISQLPWIGKTSKYVWIRNLQNKSNVMVQSIEGESIKFGDVTDKGLTVISDGTTVYLTAAGEVSQ
ncbi:hypothetical protein GTH52_14690 [Clostridium tyrobutyricum]|nr:hypothetical protein [Clostridium tyrobutyricum]AND85815.1 hypothetical protein CTK_C25710 [Clostridium tyrobutyricum]MBR9647978.1 hypothetical protein [Clostridium tyrobutyricum]MBV4416413.1 hypothetical protein [Clostridium tyrobutyricum]MBV4422516.1 hypothetical protein [Clostridium tyrobutyricum]MBV4428883.1 hypothetical protein [Clostridium tyrobutyricum]